MLFRSTSRLPACPATARPPSAVRTRVLGPLGRRLKPGKVKVLERETLRRPSAGAIRGGAATRSAGRPWSGSAPLPPSAEHGDERDEAGHGHGETNQTCLHALYPFVCEPPMGPAGEVSATTQGELEPEGSIRARAKERGSAPRALGARETEVPGDQRHFRPAPNMAMSATRPLTATPNLRRRAFMMVHSPCLATPIDAAVGTHRPLSVVAEGPLGR